MKCNYCEYEVREDCKCCPNCGENPKTRKKNTIKDQVKEEEKTTKVVVNTENLYPLWGVLGFFIPIAGAILFFVWLKTKPKEAKAAGIGALARVASYVFYFIVFIIFQILTNK